MSSDTPITANDPGVILPDAVITPVDLGKLQREVFALNEFMAASATKTGSRNMPFMSGALKSLAKQSNVNLLNAEERAALLKRLEFVRRTAPGVQMSFASDPSKQALRLLVRWFRENGHPNTLITVGVQPNIAGGCVVRTATKTFDFSLQQLFQANRDALAQRFV